MKYLFLVLVAILTQTEARAERWILKNPKVSLQNYKVVKSFELGADHYVVVNLPDFMPLGFSLQSVAEKAMEDLPISLPQAEEGDVFGSERAWHVDRLNYASLPAEKDGRGIVVAVLDTGVDYRHSALASQMWMNTAEIPGNGIDDDHNGYVDDVYGVDLAGNDSDPVDGDMHGTHCAGVVAALPDVATGAQGAAPGARVMAVRIIGDDAKGFISDAVAGIKYAVDNGAKVLSNSWRVYRSWRQFDPSDENLALLRGAIEYARSKGVIFVAAAGNESRDLNTSEKETMFPGGFLGLSNLVVVAASDRSDQMASFSNFGATYVSVAAPGRDIISTVPGNYWKAMSGTSMATPMVAGSLARGLSAGFSASEAISRLASTSSQLDAWRYKVKAGGIIQLTEYLK